MPSKLYVGNLPYNTEEGKLEELFASVGTVESVKIIRDQETGRSKGFGFVEVASDEEADSAVENLNGKDFDGRSLKVDKARPPQKGGGGGGRGGRFNNRGGGGGRGRY